MNLVIKCITRSANIPASWMGTLWTLRSLATEGFEYEKLIVFRVSFKPQTRGPYSQNFLCQIRKFFVTLGVNIIGFLRLKVGFLKQISVKLDVIYYTSNKTPNSYVWLALKSMWKLGRF